MATIRLTQIDGKFPNLALMKLSHWHKSNGDTVYFERGITKGMFEPDYDIIYGSAIFSTSEKKINQFKRNFPNAIVGGTGTDDNNTTVEKIIQKRLQDKVDSFFGEGRMSAKFLMENIKGFDDDFQIDLYQKLGKEFFTEYPSEYEYYDYEIYPDFDGSIGFSQRGCRLRCKFCVVPKKEGKNVNSNTIYNIWKQNPKNKGKKIHLLDNDFFGQPNWQEKANEIIDGNYRVCFNQGINIRLIDDEGASYLSRMKFRDDSFKKKRIYTAWDNKRDETIFLKGINCILNAGIKPNEVMVYFLCNYWEKGLTQDVWDRFNTMAEIGLLPYPMIFEKWTASAELKAFQEWVIRGGYRVTPFETFMKETKKQYFERKQQTNAYTIF
jgi:hypothetical protein